MRRVSIIASAFAISCLLPVVAASAASAADPTGIWINDTGRGAIEIKACGNALCGNVVWVKDTGDAKGCGKQIIGNVVPTGGGLWDNGWIYSPERGRKYNVELKPLANGTLRVTGYAGMRFLSKTMIWTRAPADLQLCGETDKQIEAKAGQPVDAKPDSKSATSAAAKPEANSQVAIVTPPAPASASTVTPADKPDAKPAASEKASPQPESNANEAAKPKGEPPAASNDAKPDVSQKNEETASADDGASSELGDKLNDLGLGKVFTKTKSGKCKLDLPWVKLTLNCEQ